MILQGKHAVVTGGASGIGAAIATLLRDHGATVTVIGRHTAPIAADISNPDAVSEAFNQARAQSGPIDILINNAGQAESAPFLKITLDQWRRMQSVNLDGTFLCTQAALPDMLKSAWGRIVNISSTAGLKGYPYVSAYSAAKHGVIGLTRSLALELAAKNITVNAVCPGFTDTAMLQRAVDNIVAKTARTPEQTRTELAALNPQHRLVLPQEVANAVAWLVLPGSESITGQAISVSGGETT